jgi:hypothetical protein
LQKSLPRLVCFFHEQKCKHDDTGEDGPKQEGMLKVLQVNLNCCVRAQDLLKATARQQQTDVVLVSEPTSSRPVKNGAGERGAIMNRIAKPGVTQHGFGERFTGLKTLTIYSRYIGCVKKDGHQRRYTI